MYDRFEKWMQDSGMAGLLEHHGAVLAGYSGGADSTLLLHWLNRYCRGRGIRLYAAHVHHGIRGAEAERDLEHCVRTAEELAVPLYTLRTDIPRLAAERSVGLEECARTERYRFFDTVCLELDRPAMPVATAHNGDDQLETVLFHMLRGSGLHGMIGIRPIRDDRFLRPLLWMNGEEIRETCRREGLLWVEDSTNADTGYTRNYIRHVLVPAMRPLCRNPQEAVARMTALLSRDDAYLEGEADRLCGSIAGTACDREVLQTLHPALASRILRRLYKRVYPTGELSAERTETLLTLLRDRDSGETKSVSLPGSVWAEISRTAVYFRLQPARNHAEPLPSPIELSLPEAGESTVLDWSDWKLMLCRKNLPECPEKLENIYKLSIQQPINFAKIKSVLRLRTRLPGDTIRYGGMTRKLKKLFSEAHIVPEERERLPILADEDGVLWAAGFPVCDRVRSEEATEPLLWIVLYQKERSFEKDSMEDLHGTQD